MTHVIVYSTTSTATNMYKKRKTTKPFRSNSGWRMITAGPLRPLLRQGESGVCGVGSRQAFSHKGEMQPVMFRQELADYRAHSSVRLPKTSNSSSKIKRQVAAP